MAKINESVMVIKVSELVKDNEEKPSPLTDEMVTPSCSYSRRVGWSSDFS